jgi:tripartite-type tricarboxylate transporter receptor subunit TctC
VFAPVKTPRAIIQRLYEEISKAQRDPVAKENLAKLGGQPIPMTPTQFDQYVRKGIKQNAAPVKAIGIKLQ